MLINILRYSRFLYVYKSLWENPTSGAAGAVMVQFLGSQTNMMCKTTRVACGGMCSCLQLTGVLFIAIKPYMLCLSYTILQYCNHRSDKIDLIVKESFLTMFTIEVIDYYAKDGGSQKNV